MTIGEREEEAFLVALLGLPGIGPSRLSALLAGETAKGAWEKLHSRRVVAVAGVSTEQIAKWRAAARATSVEAEFQRVAELGMWVHRRGSDTFPQRLKDDIEPPHLLFGLGSEGVAGPTVGIVGTRNCTSYGKRCAFEFGAELAKAGVSVVSGLALGIDAAAHQGVLSVHDSHRAPPIGVVGSGLDIIYPKRNAKLWRDVADAGSLVSETPPGKGPKKWRFPARNRIIAALSDAVVVIESHSSGGSLSTVDAAQERDIPVGAVPGPITSNSSVGTNRLLAEGATPVLSVEDILLMIGHHPPTVIPDGDSADGRSSAFLEALGWNPVLFDELCSRVTLSPSAVAVEVEHLVAEGLCAKAGPWIERVR